MVRQLHNRKPRDPNHSPCPQEKSEQEKKEQKQAHTLTSHHFSISFPDTSTTSSSFHWIWRRRRRGSTFRTKTHHQCQFVCTLGGNTCSTSVWREMKEHLTTFLLASLSSVCCSTRITTLSLLLQPILDGRKRNATIKTQLREHSTKHPNLRVQVKQNTVLPHRQENSTMFGHQLTMKGRSSCAARSPPASVFLKASSRADTGLRVFPTSLAALPHGSQSVVHCPDRSIRLHSPLFLCFSKGSWPCH